MKIFLKLLVATIAIAGQMMAMSMDTNTFDVTLRTNSDIPANALPLKKLWALCRNHDGKLIAKVKVAVSPEEYKLKIPVDARQITIAPYPFVFSNETPICIGHQLNIEPSTSNYHVKFVMVPPVKVKILLKKIDKRSNLLNCKLLNEDGTEYSFSPQIDANGEIVFWGVPGCKYQLQARVLFDRQAVSIKSDTYTAIAGQDNQYVWEMPSWKLVDINCYESIGGKKAKCPEGASIFIGDQNKDIGLWFPLVEGHKLLCLNDNIGGLNSLKKLYFDFAVPGKPDKYQIIHGAEADVDSSRHEIIVHKKAPRKEVLVTVTDNFGKPLSSRMVAIPPKSASTDAQRWSRLEKWHLVQGNTKHELIFHSPGYLAKRFRNVAIDSTTQNKLSIGKLEGANVVSGTVTNAGEFPVDHVAGIPSVILSVIYPQLFGTFTIEDPVDYDPTTGAFTAKCDLRLHPYLSCKYRHGDLTSLTVFPLTSDDAGSTQTISLHPHTLLTGIIPPELCVRKDPNGHSYNHLVFVDSRTGIISGAVDNITPNGKWKMDIQPGEYRLLLLGPTHGIELSSKVVVGDEPQTCVVPVPERFNQIKPQTIPELLTNNVNALDLRIIP